MSNTSTTRHVEYLANGLGGPSMLLLAYACERKIPATVSITADTGSERDRVMSTGERVTAAEYFARVVEPLAREGGVDARFVRAQNGEGEPMVSLWDHTRAAVGADRLSALKLPVFGSNGGRLGQSCTSRWKLAAIHQELRRAGARTAKGAQGIHAGEAWRRVKGLYTTEADGFDCYRPPDGHGGYYQWMRIYYPFVDLRLNRERIGEELDRRSIPYLVTSECDMCPHQDLARWERHTAETIDEIAAVEAEMRGEYFFTDLRIPLRDALAEWRRRRDAQPSLFDTEADFGCRSEGLCGV